MPGELYRPRHLHTADQPRFAIAAAEFVARQQADELVRLDAGALDEGDHDVAGARLHLHRDVREALDDLRATRGALAVHGAQIVGAADVAAEHLPAVHQQQHGVAGVEHARVEVDAEIDDGDAILAVGRKVVAELHPAARAQRQAVDVIGLLGRGQRVGGVGDLRGIADGQLRREPGGRDVLIEERRRHRERRGNVLEAVDLDLRRQDLHGVEFDAEQVVDRGGELRAREALRRHMARGGSGGGCGVEPALQPGDERVDLRLARLSRRGRRHQPSPQLAHRLLPDVGVSVHAVEREGVERKAARLGSGVVAADAVGIECSPRLDGARACRRRGRTSRCDLRPPRGRQRGQHDSQTKCPFHASDRMIARLGESLALSL